MNSKIRLTFPYELCIPAIIGSIFSSLMTYYFFLGHDTAAYLSSTGILLDGTTINDPLTIHDAPIVIILSMIPILIHRFIPFIDIITSFVIFTLILLNFSMVVCFKIIKQIPGFTDKNGIFVIFSYLYYITTVIATIQSIIHFGEREHQVAILILPYLFSVIALVYNVKPSIKLQFIIGAMAAIGFCIKPQFALLFFVSEFFVMIYQRKIFSWFRPEALIIGLFGIFYLISWKLFYPVYFDDLRYTFVTFNRVISSVPLLQTLVIITSWRMGVIVWIIFPLSLAVTKGKDKWGVVYGMLLAITSIIILLQQERANASHIYLVIFFIFFQLLLVCRKFSPWGMLIALPLLTLFAFSTHDPQIWPGNTLIEQKIESRRQILQNAQKLAPYIDGKKVTILTIPAPTIALWPIVIMTEAKLDNPIRDFTYLSLLYNRTHKYYTPPEELLPDEQYQQNNVITFFEQKKPEWVLVSHYTENNVPQDIIQQLKTEPRFRKIWENYHLVTSSDMTLYIKQDMVLKLYHLINTSEGFRDSHTYHLKK